MSSVASHSAALAGSQHAPRPTPSAPSSPRSSSISSDLSVRSQPQLALRMLARCRLSRVRVGARASMRASAQVAAAPPHGAHEVLVFCGAVSCGVRLRTPRLHAALHHSQAHLAGTRTPHAVALTQSGRTRATGSQLCGLQACLHADAGLLMRTSPASALPSAGSRHPACLARARPCEASSRSAPAAIICWEQRSFPRTCQSRALCV